MNLSPLRFNNKPVLFVLVLLLSLPVIANSAEDFHIDLPEENYNFDFNGQYDFALAQAVTEPQLQTAITPDFKTYESDSYISGLFSANNPGNGERLWSQTKLIFGLGFAVIGVIYMMPESVSNWDKDDSGDIGKKWKKNVTSGPTWDSDDAGLNYIGHPYFGGVYYQVARNSGYSQWDSFVYTTLMSTFYWEYGIEAFSEVPSIQDLIVTPVGGWIYGEWAFQQQHKIIRRGGTVWGSKAVGGISLFFLDPVDSIAGGINNLFNSEVITSGSVYFSTSPKLVEPKVAVKMHDYFGIELQLTYR
ncbi:MAG: DUF3943 domain-containing protein [Sinobacterium sp.]|nr:DUF3943 domain-containing protein [Sinobacterium sp.]